MQAIELTHRAGCRVALGLVVGWLVGCASDVQSDQEAIVGSRQVIEHSTPVEVVRSLRIRVPFRVSLQAGAPKQILLRGENNLLDEIVVEEDAVDSWRIEAPLVLRFTQHDEIAITVPYIDMVEIKYNSNNVRFIDKPGGSQQEPAD